MIGVDPGHGGYDGGCVSVTGVAEKEYNLAVALLVGEEIRALAARPSFTRETDKALIDPEKTTGYKKRKELDNRIALLQEAQVDALVSIHMNNYTVSKYRGAPTVLPGRQHRRRAAGPLPSGGPGRPGGGASAGALLWGLLHFKCL